MGGVGKVDHANVYQLVNIASQTVTAPIIIIEALFGGGHLVCISFVYKQKRTGVETECIQLHNDRAQLFQLFNQFVQQITCYKIFIRYKILKRTSKAFWCQFSAIVLVVANESVQICIIYLVKEK